MYRFFRDELQAQHIQLIPIVKRTTEQTIAFANQGWGGLKGTDRPLYKQEGNLVTERTVTAEQFGKFLIGIYDEWVQRDVGKVYVITFDVALGSWLGQHNACIVSPTCGRALTMEHNGDVYSCDHYVEPDYLLGNIKDTPLQTLVASEKQRRFGQSKYDTLPKFCKECPVLFACYGECPRNRFIKTPDGEDGLNYLCRLQGLLYSHRSDDEDHGGPAPPGPLRGRDHATDQDRSRREKMTTNPTRLKDSTESSGSMSVTRRLTGSRNSLPKRRMPAGRSAIMRPTKMAEPPAAFRPTRALLTSLRR